MLTRRILRTIDLSPTWVLFPKLPRESLLRNFKHILKRTACTQVSSQRTGGVIALKRLCYGWQMTFFVPQIVARNACLYFWIFQAHLMLLISEYSLNAWLNGMELQERLMIGLHLISPTAVKRLSLTTKHPILNVLFKVYPRDLLLAL